MKRSQLLAVAALLLPLATATGQRTGDGRIGIPPVHQDSATPSREALFLQRAVQSSYTAIIAVVPFALYAIQHDGPVSEGLVVGGTISYLAAAAWGAARRPSRDCSLGNRLWRATGGALAGATAGLLTHIAGDGDEYYEHHVNDTRISASTLLVGVPLGAAASLYNCR